MVSGSRGSTQKLKSGGYRGKAGPFRAGFPLDFQGICTFGGSSGSALFDNSAVWVAANGALRNDK